MKIDRSPFGPYRGLALRCFNHARAIKKFGQAIELNPEDATAYYNRGIAYALSRNYTRAIEDLGRAIELNPEDAAAYYNRGLAYAQLQDHARAIEDYSQAIELKPAHPAAYNNRGLVYARLQDYERAIEDFGRAIEVHLRFDPAYYNAARMYALMGKASKACEWLEKAIGLDRKYQRLAWSDKDFVGMREDERFKALVGMNEYYEIIPGESIGPFKLGMTRNEIAGLNIHPMERFEDNTGVRFPSLDVTVYYDASGKCGKIEANVFSRSAPTFVLLGHIVNDVSEDEAVKIFSSVSSFINFGYASFELPGLRAIKWEASDDFIFVIEVSPQKGATDQVLQLTGATLLDFA